MTSTYKRLPCTTCIVFAKCQHKQPLKCKLLYEYMRNVDPKKSFNRKKTPTDRYRLMLIETAFKKMVGDYYVIRDNQLLIRWTTPQQIEEEVMMSVFRCK